jgi:MFS family permease
VLGVLTPVLPQYVRERLHGGSVAVGFVMGGFAIVALVCRPLAGSLSDRIGPGRTTALGGLITAVSALGFFVPGYTGVVVARFAFGVGEAMMTSATMAWAVGLAPAAKRGQMIGLFGLSIWTGLTLGPQIGVLLLAHGYAAVWLFAFASPLLGGLLAATLKSGRLPPSAERLGRPALRELVPRSVLRPGFAIALAASGEGVLTAFIVLHLADKALGGTDPTRAGARVYTVFAFAVIVGRVFGGRLTDRLGGASSARIASVCEAAGLIVIGIGPSFAGVLGGAVLTGAGFAIIFPALAVLAVEGVDERRRGSGIAAFTAFFDIGYSSGAVIGGAIAAFVGYDGAFWYATAAALAINVALGRPSARRWPRHPEAENA